VVTNRSYKSVFIEIVPQRDGPDRQTVKTVPRDHTYDTYTSCITALSGENHWQRLYTRKLCYRKDDRAMRAI